MSTTSDNVLAKFMEPLKRHSDHTHVSHDWDKVVKGWRLSAPESAKFQGLLRDAYARVRHNLEELLAGDVTELADGRDANGYPLFSTLNFPVFMVKNRTPSKRSWTMAYWALYGYLDLFPGQSPDTNVNSMAGGSSCIPAEYMVVYHYLYCEAYNAATNVHAVEKTPLEKLGVPMISEKCRRGFFMKLFFDIDWKQGVWEKFFVAYALELDAFRAAMRDLVVETLTRVRYDECDEASVLIAVKDRSPNIHIICQDTWVAKSDIEQYVTTLQQLCKDKWPSKGQFDTSDWVGIVDKQASLNQNLRSIGSFKPVRQDDRQVVRQETRPNDVYLPWNDDDWTKTGGKLLRPRHLEKYSIQTHVPIEEAMDGSAVANYMPATDATDDMDGAIRAYVQHLHETNAFGHEELRLEIASVKIGPFHKTDGCPFEYYVNLADRWCPFKGGMHGKRKPFLLVRMQGCRLKCSHSGGSHDHVEPGQKAVLPSDGGWVPLTEALLSVAARAVPAGPVAQGKRRRDSDSGDDEEVLRQRLHDLVDDVTANEVQLWDACEWNEGPTDEMVDLFKRRLCVRGNKLTMFDLSDMVYMVVQKVFRAVDAKDKTIYIFRHHEHRYEKIGQSFTDCMRHILIPIVREFVKRNLEMVVQDRKLLAGIDSVIWRAGELGIVTAFNGMVAKLHREYGSFEDLRDKDRNLVGFQNCVVVLNEKERLQKEKRHADFNVRYVALSRPGCPMDHVTMRMGVDFIPPTVDLMTPDRLRVRRKIMGFLEAIFTSPEVTQYVLRVVAGCLGRPKSPKFFVLTGHGSNGKTMFQRLVQSTFGDYYKETSPGILTQKSAHYSSANPTIMGLKNKRVYFVSEPDVVSDEGARFNEPAMKKLAGGEEWEARDLYQKGTEMVRVEACAFLLCNALPSITGSDDGIWRRFVFVEMRTRFKKGLKKSEETPFLRAADETIQDKIETKWKHEFGSMLVELYSEMHFHRKGGFCVEENLPVELKEVGASVQRDMCSLLTFVSENLEARATSNKLAFADVYTAYKRFLAEVGDGHKVDNVRTVKRALQSRSMDVGADGMCKCVWKANSKYKNNNNPDDREVLAEIPQNQ